VSTSGRERVAWPRRINSADAGVVASLQRPCVVDAVLPAGGVVPDLVLLLRGQGPGMARAGAAECRAHLVAHAQHIGSRHGEDKGWGCGFRNLQMLLWHLYRRGRGRELKGALFGGAGIVPDVASLQAWIEWAWHQGFDEAGASSMGHSAQVLESRAREGFWMGTVDVKAMLGAFGVRADIVDFRGQPSRRLLAGAKRHRDQGAGPASGPPPPPPPRKEPDHEAVLRWVWSYFAAAGTVEHHGQGEAISVRTTTACPLYFQHDGHSRLIVGVQTLTRGGPAGQRKLCLVLLDPGTSSASFCKRHLHPGSPPERRYRSLLVGVDELRRRPEYQVLYVPDAPVVPEGPQRDEMKVIRPAEVVYIQ